MPLYVVRYGNVGYAPDESIECESAADVKETVKDVISDFRQDGFYLESGRIRRLSSPGDSYRAALLTSNALPVEIRVQRVE